MLCSTDVLCSRVPPGTMWCFAAHLYLMALCGALQHTCASWHRVVLLCLMALCGALQHTYAWSVVLCSTLVPHGTVWCFAAHLCLKCGALQHTCTSWHCVVLCKTLVPHNALQNTCASQHCFVLQRPYCSGTWHHTVEELTWPEGLAQSLVWH